MARESWEVMHTLRCPFECSLHARSEPVLIKSPWSAMRERRTSSDIMPKHSSLLQASACISSSLWAEDTLCCRWTMGRFRPRTTPIASSLATITKSYRHRPRIDASSRVSWRPSRHACLPQPSLAIKYTKSQARDKEFQNLSI